MGLKDLARRDRSTGTGQGLDRPSARPDAGPGSDITSVKFSGRAITYETDMPAVFRKGAAAAGTALVPSRAARTGPGSALVPASNVVAPKSAAVTEKVAKQVIASGARQIEKPRRSGGRVVQRRVGWQATPTVIVVTTAERELTKREDGRYAPSGEWQVEHRMTYPCSTGAAEKRVGQVPFDGLGQGAAPVASAGTGAPVGPPSPGGADPFPEGTTALSFLPSSVRVSALARVPEPTVFDGTVLQFAETATGKVRRHEVNVIRMDATTAVVIQARREPDATAWEVSQAVYALGEPEVEQV